jgi:general secretion pathway protein A
MYRAFFGLGEKPFAITPDPRYLYLSTRHAEALAHLVYGINDAGGFIQLTGEVGTGKTTTIRSLLARAPKNAEIALIINPRMSSIEFLQTICEELGLGLPDSAENNIKELVDLLNRYLLRAHAEGRRVVLIVDEAQNLLPEVLEQVRLLTNLETESQKLLQIILIGQPELRDLLARNDLRQLAQRITARYHLAPLTAEESAAYVRHRLRVAGATSDIFSDAALREVYRISGGVPRVINVIADRALLGAYTSDQHEVTPQLVRQAGSEVFSQRLASPWLAPLVTTLVLVSLVASALAIWKLGPWNRESAPAVSVTPAAVSGTNGAPSSGVAGPASGAAATPIITATAPVSGPLVTMLSGLLQRPNLPDSADAALGELLKLWGAEPAPNGTDACSAATRQGLECVSLRSTLAQLHELNRPAVLTLSDDNRRVHQVVLTQLDDEHAWLRVGTQDIYVGIADLSRYWFGDLVLLWRPPAATANRMSRGSRGPAVQMLQERLLRWSGVAPSAAPVGTVFDADLQQRVEQFQLAHHLTADGNAGLDTQLLLDSVLAAPGTPQLRKIAPRG